MNIDWAKTSVLVTGANGFLGKHLVNELRSIGAHVWDVDHRYDLTQPEEADFAVSGRRAVAEPPDVVFHLAGYNGGIQFNLDNPARIFANNTMMALNVLEACRKYKVKKVVSVVASCAYPAVQLQDEGWGCGYTLMERSICPEDEFMAGSPHGSVACHGYAKRNLQLASSFYYQQYGLQAVCACPTTLYGPGDSFDPQRTKVMGAMVKRFVDAARKGDHKVTCWGTGKPLREFLFVRDAAKLLIQVAEHYNNSDLPLNLGSGQELSMKALAEKVAYHAGYQRPIFWDTSKPDGQFRKRLDLTRMRSILPGIQLTPLYDGIAETVKFYANS